MKNYQKDKQRKKRIRIKRVRARIFGTKEIPRVAVYRSLRQISAQVINDTKGRTLVSVSDRDVKGKGKLSKTEVAREVGKVLAKKATAAKIKKVLFDRRSYQYHGRVKALAEGMRQGGLDF